jgi:hypothetical protein
VCGEWKRSLSLYLIYTLSTTLEAGAVLLLFFPSPPFFFSWFFPGRLFWERTGQRALEGVKIRGFSVGVFLIFKWAFCFSN